MKKTPDRAINWRRTAKKALAASVLATMLAAPAAWAQVPEGFTPIFDGETTEGWHWGLTNHHGTTGGVTVEDGDLVLRQAPYGQGGLLMSDKAYENFELYMEMKTQYGTNSGIFFRSSDGGSAYQIEVVQGSNVGELISEAMWLSKEVPPVENFNDAWKNDEWNQVLLRVDGGDKPHMTLWINDVEIWDVQFEKNDKIAGEVAGQIGLQLHWSSVYEPEVAKRNGGTSWKPHAEIRYREIAVKELP